MLIEWPTKAGWYQSLSASRGLRGHAVSENRTRSIDGDIRFYCRHDALIDRVRKFRKENNESMFLKSLNPSKIFSNGIASTVSNENAENRIFPSASESLVGKHSKFKKNHSNIENVESNLISRLTMPSSDNNIVPANVSKLSADERIFKDEEMSKNRVFANLTPENLAATKVESVNFKEKKGVSKHTLNFYGKNKFMNADQRQKVIQKLGEEVQKMLSWHEQFTLSDHLRVDSSSVSNRAVSKIDILGTTTSSKKLSPVLSIEPKIKIDIVKSKKETQNSDTKTDFQSSSKIVDIEPDLAPCIETSNQTDRVSSTNSGEDVAYEDDWEEEYNISAKNESEQSIDEGNNGDSKSVGQEAVKLASAETKRNNQDEPEEAIAIVVGKNEDTSVSSSKKSQVIPENSDIANESSSNSSEKKSLESGSSFENSKALSTQKSSPQLKAISGSVTSHCSKRSSDLLTRNKLSKNASQTGSSETDVVSDFSDQEGVSANTSSNNAQNSNSDFKKSCVDSEAETVKDLSLLNSEVVDTDSKVTMSLHIQEDSYKENNSENFKRYSLTKFSAPSECDSLLSDVGLEVSECGVMNQNEASSRGTIGKSKNDSGNKTPKSGSISPVKNGLNIKSEASMKLSRSCHELAEKVLHIEQMKNDLLKVLIKPENKLLNQVPSIQSLPDTLGEKEESKYSPSSGSGHKLDEKNKISNTTNSGIDTYISSTHDDVTNNVDESTNSHQIVFLGDECEKSNQSYIVLYETKANFKSESSSSEKSFLSERNQQVSKSVFIESSSNSSECSSNSEIRNSSTEVVPEANNSQPAISISKNVSEGGVCSQPKQSEFVSRKEVKNKNCSPSLFDKDVRSGGNSVAKSFVELSNEILNHLKQEAELLTQFDSTTSIWETSSEADDSVGSAKRAVSSAESSGSQKHCILQNKNLSSPLKFASDVVDVPFLSSDGSLLDFEYLMSELSENMDNKSDDFSGDSVDEIFSIISSERYKVDSSKNLESSIKEALFSADGDRSNFVLESF